MSAANNSTKKYMDVVRSTDPLVRHAATRSAQPAKSAKAHEKHPTKRSAQQPAQRPLSRLTEKPAEKPSPRPVVARTPLSLPSRVPLVPRPAPSSTPAKKPSFLGKLTKKSSVSVTKSTGRSGVVEHLGEIPREKSAPVRPNFIHTDTIEKRPLGSVSRASILDDAPQQKYDPSTDPRRTRAADPVRKPSKKKHTSIPLPLIVVITIILGIASGIGVYFLLSK